MFGYIIVNKQEMKFKEFDVYRSYYCGFCQELKKAYGKRGQLTLSYDLTFLILLLTGLYEPKTAAGFCRCFAHPFERHAIRRNEYTGYAADMNLLLSYHKCEDDWLDERKAVKKVMSGLLKSRVERIRRTYPKKSGVMQEKLSEIHRYEQAGSRDIDAVSGCFGGIMAEVFAYREDEWETDLRRMGFFLGKFIYLMDAWEDMEKDEKKGNYNPFLLRGEQEQDCRRVLTMMMAECSQAFERLPIVEYVEILRNILYSGVWLRYEAVGQRRMQGEAGEQPGKAEETMDKQEQ